MEEIILMDVYGKGEVQIPSNNHVNFLYKLLLERDLNYAISHDGKTTFEQHKKFVEAIPYDSWNIIRLIDDGYLGRAIGSVYLTYENEIGIFILKEHQRKGYGKAALQKFILECVYKTKWINPYFLANIHPKNEASIKFFESFGFKLIQNRIVLSVPSSVQSTYRLY